MSLVKLRLAKEAAFPARKNSTWEDAGVKGRSPPKGVAPLTLREQLKRRSLCSGDGYVTHVSVAALKKGVYALLPSVLFRRRPHQKPYCFNRTVKEKFLPPAPDSFQYLCLYGAACPPGLSGLTKL